ncbi:MAG TPA: hypothetical protein VN040_16045 [Pseudosphingobacterium sp.]|nr:hypothetical protein [Pseudosphingobacterium sp.]
MAARQCCAGKTKKEGIMNGLQNMWKQRQEAINRQWVASALATLLFTFFRYYGSLLICVVFVPRYPAFPFHLPFLRFIHRWFYRRKFALFPGRPWMA